MELVFRNALADAGAMKPTFELLRATLKVIAPLEAHDWQRLTAVIEPKRFAGGAHLQRAGEPCERIYFLNSGLVREYYRRSDGTERTRAFARSGNFSSSYADYLMNRNAQVSIEALQDTDVLALPLHSLDTLRSMHRSLDVAGRRLLEQMYVQKEKREFQFLTMTPSERYWHLTEDYPGIETVVQQYHIASYLGITPVALSRIRRRKRDGG